MTVFLTHPVTVTSLLHWHDSYYPCSSPALHHLCSCELYYLSFHLWINHIIDFHFCKTPNSTFSLSENLVTLFSTKFWETGMYSSLVVYMKNPNLVSLLEEFLYALLNIPTAGDMLATCTKTEHVLKSTHQCFLPVTCLWISHFQIMRKLLFWAIAPRMVPSPKEDLWKSKTMPFPNVWHISGCQDVCHSFFSKKVVGKPPRKSATNICMECVLQHMFNLKVWDLMQRFLCGDVWNGNVEGRKCRSLFLSLV